MGTWGTAIKSNDTSAEIYADFFDLYNEGKEPPEIKEKLISENPNGTNDFWFTLALTLWETKSLSNDVLEKVSEIIESGSDLKVWKELDASVSDIKKRKIVLENFLVKLKSNKTKPKARKKVIKKEPIFEKGSCLTFKLDNGNYGGAIVLESDFETGFGYNLIVSTKINKKSKPVFSDFIKCDVLLTDLGPFKNTPKATWYLPNKFKKDFSHLFENICKIPIEPTYNTKVFEIRTSFSSIWNLIIESINKQLEYEKMNNQPTTLSIDKLIKL